MKLIQQCLILTFSVLVFHACSSPSQNQKLETKLAEERSVQTAQDLDSEANQELKNAPGLTDDQRRKLSDLRADMLQRSGVLRTEAIKLRSVLIKDMVSQKEHVGEIELIKARLKEIEDKRLDILFKAIDDANLILGKFAAQHQKELEQTLREDRAGRVEN